MTQPEATAEINLSEANSLLNRYCQLDSCLKSLSNKEVQEVRLQLELADMYDDPVPKAIYETLMAMQVLLND